MIGISTGISARNRSSFGGGGGGFDYDPNSFVLLVQTDNPGTSNDNQFHLPVNIGTHNYTVKTSEELLENRTGNTTCTWSAPGTYVVEISGQMQHLYYNSGTDCLKVLEVLNWGDVNWLSFADAFEGCQNLTFVPDGPITGASGVFGFSFAFRDCSLSVIPQGFFDQCTNMQAVSNLFRGNGVIDSCPGDLFETQGSNIAQSPGYNGVFRECTLTTSDYSDLLINIEVNNSNTDSYLHGGNSTYNSAAAVARQALIDRGWSVTDGGPA